MGYAEQPPPAALAARVACVWWRTPDADDAASGALEPAAAAGGRATPRGPHAVLPDGCTDLVWHGGRLVVAGPDTGPVEAAPSPTTTVGVRLRPGAAAMLGEAASALRDRRVTPAALWGRAGAVLEERVADAPDDGARLRLLLEACVARGADRPTDPGVAAAVAVLTDGRATVGAAARAAGVGERQLRRRFLDHVGYGPTTLRRVLRLQCFLELAIATDDDLAGLAFRAGYADQAHLTREARGLAGTTPAALVAARRAP